MPNDIPTRAQQRVLLDLYNAPNPQEGLRLKLDLGIRLARRGWAAPGLRGDDADGEQDVGVAGSVFSNRKTVAGD